MSLPLDHIATAGYLTLFTFAAYKLQDTRKRPVDLVGNVLLLTGLGSLAYYHINKIRTQKDEKNDLRQKKVRMLAHASLTLFLMLTLMPMSAAVFRFYDSFALIAHAYLYFAVSFGAPQLAGVGLLMLYFVFATYQKTRVGGMEILQLVGRSLLLVFFIVSFAKGIMNA